MLTLLEAAIKRDHLSSEFETTSKLLNLNTQDNPSQNHVGLSGSAAVLPWVPDTTAAIALRMLDLDSAVSYMQNQKMERNGGDFMVSFHVRPQSFCALVIICTRCCSLSVNFSGYCIYTIKP